MRIYTWGNNDKGNLGHVNPLDQPYLHLRPYPHLYSTGWPDQPWIDIYLGPLAEVQCGGWCTTILTSDGSVFIMGRLDSSGPTTHGYHLRQLPFPSGWYVSSNAAYWPNTAIKQYSTGRSDVIGLSDSGLVWQWRYNNAAILITSSNIDLNQHKVLQVKAGWESCAIYAEGIGIAYWSAQHASDLVPGRSQQALQTGHQLKTNMVIIPGTAYRSSNHLSDGSDTGIGQVKEFIILEKHIVFTTHLNRVFSFEIIFPLSEFTRPQPVELTAIYSTSPSAQPFTIRSLAGCFRHFAVLTASGPIITATSYFLAAVHGHPHSYDNVPTTVSPPQPTLLPTLQTGTIVSVAFGDHHLHALHTDGTITSLGLELQGCNSLGLGNRAEKSFRGVDETQPNAARIPLTYPKQRTVWFEPLMQDWMQDLFHNLDVRDNSALNSTWARVVSGTMSLCEKYGDWFEREGRVWMGLEGARKRLEKWTINHEDGKERNKKAAPQVLNADTGEQEADEDEDEEDFPPYFTLQIAAGGWHSAALVLVDEEAAERQRQRMRDRHVVHHKRRNAWMDNWTDRVWNVGRRLIGLSVSNGQERRDWDWGTLPDYGDAMRT